MEKGYLPYNLTMAILRGKCCQGTVREQTGGSQQRLDSYNLYFSFPIGPFFSFWQQRVNLERVPSTVILTLHLVGQVEMSLARCMSY